MDNTLWGHSLQGDGRSVSGGCAAAALAGGGAGTG